MNGRLESMEPGRVLVTASLDGHDGGGPGPLSPGRWLRIGVARHARRIAVPLPATRDALLATTARWAAQVARRRRVATVPLDAVHDRGVRLSGSS